MKNKDIDIITLGCSKNLVDTERVMGMLANAGFVCHHDPETPTAPIAIINTCGFIGDAKEESIECILRMAARKTAALKDRCAEGVKTAALTDRCAEGVKTAALKDRCAEGVKTAALKDRCAEGVKTAALKDRCAERPLERLYVMGCLSQRYREELAKEIPEVDAWFGKFEWEKIVESLTPQPPLPKARGCVMRQLTTPKHYAYLKISEGCNRMCSYCAIPMITGRYTSRPMEEILDEVRWLVTQGVKEINVIAQDMSSYGLDLKAPSVGFPVEGKPSVGKYLLPELVDKMAAIEGVEWIRLHYAYPTDFPWELLPVMAKHKNVCKYLDIALQHSSDHVLGLMRRHITCAEQEEVIARIRREVPGICIRTTLLVGHPGETEEDFEQLCEWVQKMRFDRMGAFAYSDEDGTYAHVHYKDDVPEEVKQARVDKLMAIQQQISAELMQAKVGQTVRVIIDREDGEWIVGRTEADSPEVDCEVLIDRYAEGVKTAGAERPLRCKIGEFYNVKITKAEEFDLYGEIC